MTLDQAANFGEIIGAIAVIASVVYLAIQIRKQTDESRLAAMRHLGEQYVAVLDTLIEDPELLATYLKGVKDYKALPDEERLRTSLLIQKGFRIQEQQYLHTMHASVNSEYFASTNRSFVEWLTFPGILQWWSMSKDMFGIAFQERVENMIAVAENTGYTGSFGTGENVQTSK